MIQHSDFDAFQRRSTYILKRESGRSTTEGLNLSKTTHVPNAQPETELLGCLLNWDVPVVFWRRSRPGSHRTKLRPTSRMPPRDGDADYSKNKKQNTPRPATPAMTDAIFSGFDDRLGSRPTECVSKANNKPDHSLPSHGERN